MRRVCEMVAIACLLLIAACGGGGGQEAPRATDPPSIETTREPAPGTFAPKRPSDEQGALYLGYADLVLADTPWTMGRMGREQWGSMLVDGAVAACRSYHQGATTRDAMGSVLAASPYGSAIPAAEDVDAYDLLSVFFIGGVDAFCPELVEGIYGSVFAIPLDPSWEAMTGGPAPERPVRLP